jgi:mannose-1-phosphate guanylyltransferase
MKAVILAAGKGSRLKDITNHIPKPMMIFDGKPLLQHNIELCKQHGISEIYINTHHLPEKITEYFEDGSRFGVSIEYSYEPELLGTSGAVKNFQKQIGNEPFFVLYGDNVSNFNLNLLEKKNNQHIESIGTVGFHHRNDIENCGVAEFDQENKITRFIEKPKREATSSRWVNSGVYFLQPQIFDFIPESFSDFGKNVFPKLLKQKKSLYGVCCNTKVLAFDTEQLANQSKKEQL